MSVQFLWLYISLWILVLLWYLRKHKDFGVGGVLISSYLFYAIVALVLYTNPIARGLYKDLQLFPFLYLFVMLLIASLPVIQYDNGKIRNISSPNLNLLYSISSAYIIATCIQLPDTLLNIGDGIGKIIADPSGGAELYTEAHENVKRTTFGQITNIFAVIHNLLSDIAIMFFFYLLSLKKQKKWIIIGFVASMIIDILYPLSRGLRTGATMKILTIVAAYFAMKPFLDKRIKKIAKRIGIVLLFFLMTPFVLITISRFGHWDGGALYGTEYYLGQAPLRFNNYALDDGGIRYGDRTASLFKGLIYNDVPKTIMEGRAKYPNLLLDDSGFSTFVGDFAIDYGSMGAFLLFVVFSLFTCLKTRPSKGTIKFHQLLLSYFAMCVCFQGGMYLFNYAYGANLVIITFAALYFIFKMTESREHVA